MSKFIKAIALCLSLTLLLSFPVSVSAADHEPDPVPPHLIDENESTSLTLFKYDLSNAEKDGVWDSSYVSTGVYDQTVNDTLGSENRESDLGNGEVSYGYAVKGVEFTYRKVADIVQYSESAADGATDNHLEILYAVDKTAGAAFLKALGLDNGVSRYEKADSLDSAKFRLVAAIEKHHEERYRALLKNVETAEVFKKSEVKVWECRNCGHIVVGTAAPEVCPTCNHPQSYFEINAENY